MGILICDVDEDGLVGVDDLKTCVPAPDEETL